MTQTAAFEDMVDTLSRLDDWEARYHHIIALGRELPRLADHEKTDDNRVHGCVSQVWLVSRAETPAGRRSIIYRGESNAAIVQGLMAILLALYSGRDAEDISGIDALALFDQLGLRNHLTAQRSNGLAAMINRVQADARQFIAQD